jgi:hypothetical protein
LRNRSIQINFQIIVALTLMVGLGACKGKPAASLQSTAVNTSTVVVPVAATTVPPATITPTTLPERVVLLVPNGADPGLAGSLQTLLTKLSAQSGLQLQILPGLTAAELTAEVRIVVALPPDSGIAALAAAAPKTQFLAIGIPGLSAANNLNQIGAQGIRPDQQAFLAGYIASTITQDWREGALVLKDSGAGQAFLNGAIFYCGLCRPATPPFYQYPLYQDLAPGASQVEQQAAADYLLQYMVKTVYIGPGVGDDALLNYLAQAGVNIIGVTTPPAELQPHWIATLNTDLEGAVSELWPKLVQGEAISSPNLPLLITNNNPDLLSAGKVNMFNKISLDLTEGFIDTGVTMTNTVSK